MLYEKPTVSPSFPRLGLFFVLSIVHLCTIPIIKGEEEFFQQARNALQRIQTEIQQSKNQENQQSQQHQQSQEKPRKDFYESTRELFEELIRKSDFRDIQTLEQYLTVLQQIRDKLRLHAPREEIRKLQVRF